LQAATGATGCRCFVKARTAEILVVGGGPAGLSAAIYLGRAKRNTLLVDDGKSMARWEPEIQNYLGFAQGVGGPELLRRGVAQVRKYKIHLARDRIVWARARRHGFTLCGERQFYACQRLLLASGIFHIPPDIPGVNPCLGHSMFFCKDCDGYRVQGKTVAIYGWTNEAVEYALAVLLYSACVLVVTDGHDFRWDRQHSAWLREYKLPVFLPRITNVRHRGGRIRALEFGDGTETAVDALFTTRGDIYSNDLAKDLGARVDSSGEILVDEDMRTTVKGLYAAGCVTPANCQIIIAAGQGATAAQAINQDLLRESLVTHSLRRFRRHQLRTCNTAPRMRQRAFAETC
jgi:thioredoxin reductase (NADPH)